MEEVFAFFSDANTLEAMTPKQLHFHPLTPGPIQLKAGARIDYQLKLYGVPVKWATLIESWEPPRQFVDVQLRGRIGCGGTLIVSLPRARGRGFSTMSNTNYRSVHWGVWSMRYGRGARLPKYSSTVQA